LDEASTANFDDVLARLESAISRLADGTAPLDELVAAHQQAAGLLSEAQERIDVLKAHADRLVIALKE
jgi:exodeoxyribonuclease VII small subunit